MRDFYEELKRLCELNNMNIEGVVRAATNNQSGYTKYWSWKRQGTFPRADELYKMCKTLGVSMEHFFEDGETETVKTKQKEVVDLFDNLSLSSQDQVLSLLKTLQGK